MALVLADIKSRVKTEGKDALNQYPSLIESYVKDTVREITLTLDWAFQQKIGTLSLTSTWIDLPVDFKKMLMFMYEDRQLLPLTESDYYQKKFQFGSDYYNDMRSYYRIRWNDSTQRWQTFFINMPTSGTADYLYAWYTDDVTKVPDWLEEAIVLGATFRFTRHVGGDDMEVSKDYESKYRSLVEYFKGYMDSDRYSVEPDRVKTNAEIELEFVRRSDV